MKSTRATARVLDGAKTDFFKRHRKDKPRAEAAWEDLVAAGAALEQDTTFGDPIERNRWPKAHRDRPNLYRLLLTGGLRAIYTVLFIQGEGHVVRIDWVGDHKEYDRLFGCSTSQGLVTQQALQKPRPQQEAERRFAKHLVQQALRARRRMRRLKERGRGALDYPKS